MENLTEFIRTGRIIADSLHKKRVEMGLSTKEAAKLSGVKEDRLIRMESGDLEFISPVYLIALLREYALALGTYDRELFKELNQTAGIRVHPAQQKSLEQSPGQDHSLSINRNAVAAAGIAAVLIIGALFLSRTYRTPAETPALEVPPARAGYSSAPTPAAELPGQETKQDGAHAATAHNGCFTLSINKETREPNGRLNRIPSGAGTIIYFSDIHRPSGKPLYHEWSFNGKQVDKIAVGRPSGPRWRSWSRKTVGKEGNGVWRVRVREGDGVVLRADSILSGKPPAAAE